MDVTVTESAWAQEEEWEWICGTASSITLNLSFLFIHINYITLNLVNNSFFSFFFFPSLSTFLLIYRQMSNVLYPCTVTYTLNGALQLTPANIFSHPASCFSMSCPSADETSTSKKTPVKRDWLISSREKHKNQKEEMSWEKDKNQNWRQATALDHMALYLFFLMHIVLIESLNKKTTRVNM